MSKGGNKTMQFNHFNRMLKIAFITLLSGQDFTNSSASAL